MSYSRSMPFRNYNISEEVLDSIRKLYDFCEIPGNIEILQKLTDNLNAIADKEPLPYPEMLEKDFEINHTKKLKLNNETNLDRPSELQNLNEENLYQEIKKAINEEDSGNIDNQYLNNIKEILNQKPDLINKRASSLMVTPLSKAVCCGAVNLTKELLKFEPNLFMINSFGETTLNQAMKITRTNKSSKVFNSCVEILKAHQKAGTIDTSVFNDKINQEQNCYQLMANIIKVDLNTII